MTLDPAAENTPRLYRSLAVTGAVLVSVSSLVGSGFNPLALPFALWSLLPYALLWTLGSRIANGWLTAGAGLAALAADIGIRAAVFIWPRGSTAAIALVFSPIYIAVVFLPVGAAAGWLLGRAWRWNLVGRALTVVTVPAALGLIVLGLARPEFFPTTVAQRRAVLERVGPPRIVAGADRFEWVPVTSTPAWHLAVDLDGQPGDEVAVITHGSADVLDSATMQKTGRIEFGRQDVWGPFSMLVRARDGYVIAQTGGGYSRTLLQDLQGNELWEYKPDPKLMPTAMRPADLDGDGEAEFYASTHHAVSRLDSRGREVWSRPATLATVLAVLPASGDQPAWVVGFEYGQRAMVWDAAGRLVAERPVSAQDSPMTALDSFAGRVLVHGGHSARGYDTSGAQAFDIPLGDFTLSTADSARLPRAAEPGIPLLVLVGATDRDTGRYRLLIAGGNNQVVYDEVLAEYPRVVIARRADGSDAVLAGGTGSLRWLRER